MILMGNGEDDCRIDDHEDECKFVKNADRETYAYRKKNTFMGDQNEMTKGESTPIRMNDAIGEMAREREQSRSRRKVVSADRR